MQLYIVELKTRGWTVGISHIPEERVLTTVFRLSRKQRNRLQYLKVKFYRVLEKYSVFTLGDKYVVSQRHLPEVEKRFSEIYSEFVELRREIFNEITEKWDEIQGRLEERVRSMGLPATRLHRLKPEDEAFLEMYYVVTPLSFTVDQLAKVSEEFEKLARERDEYKMIAKRVRDEAERNLAEVRKAYEEKVRELERAVEELKRALKERSKEVYRLRMRIKEAAEDAHDIASFLGSNTLEDLKARLEGLKEFFAT
ncbi:MAG: hypothetical protein QXI55_05735 [Thermofilum sp.]